MYQTNIKVVHLLEESPMKQSELIQSIGLVRGVIGSRKSSKMTKKEPIFEEKSLKKTPLAHSKNHKYI